MPGCLRGAAVVFPADPEVIVGLEYEIDVMGRVGLIGLDRRLSIGDPCGPTVVAAVDVYDPVGRSGPRMVDVEHDPVEPRHLKLALACTGDSRVEQVIEVRIRPWGCAAVVDNGLFAHFLFFLF